MVSYTMASDDSVVLHVAELKNSDGLQKAIRFLDGLRKLNNKLRTEEKFIRTKEVAMFSWAVTQFAPFLKDLGFEIHSDNSHPLWNELETDYREMAKRNRVLKRYVGITPSLAVMQKEVFLNHPRFQPSTPERPNL